MPTLKQINFASLLVFAVLSTAIAQESTSLSDQRSTLTITANATGDRVRVTAPSSVVQMHLEVYAASGEKVFDEELRGANVFDWHVQNGQAQRLPAGDYVCVVTAKNVSGKLTQKIGAVTVAENSASVRPGDPQQLSLSQAQAIGPVEADSSWTIMAEGDNQTTTVIANNGTDGQMIRGRGALTFRIGNFFSGLDKEQMRLTEEGNLGIGTSTPQSKLDVAGTIRAERFVVATPKLAGSEKTAANTQAADSGDEVQPLASGSGTQDRIAKWTDNAGTLGDSGITETAAGNVGIGTTSPVSGLDIVSSTVMTASWNRNLLLKSMFPVMAFHSTYGAGSFAGIGYDSTGPGMAFWNNAPSVDLGASTPVMYLRGANLGIGTTSPISGLDIVSSTVMTGSWNRNLLLKSSFPVMAFHSTYGAGSFAGIGYDSTGPGMAFWNNAPSVDLGASTPVMYLRGANVGIGTSAPGYILDVVGRSRIRQNAGGTGGTNSAGLWLFQNTPAADRAFVGMETDNSVGFFGNNGGGWGLIMNTQTGDVGIGTTGPTSKLTVAGTVESQSGGFKFPDGSVQTSAASNAIYTTRTYTDGAELPCCTLTYTTLLHLNLPAGSYLLSASVQFRNQANFFNEDNSRTVDCRFSTDDDSNFGSAFKLQSLTRSTMSLHSVTAIPAGGVDFQCRDSTSPLQTSHASSAIFPEARRFTAVKIDGNVIVQ